MIIYIIRSLKGGQRRAFLAVFSPPATIAPTAVPISPRMTALPSALATWRCRFKAWEWALAQAR